VLYLNLPSICHTSGLVFRCHCRFKFVGLSFDFLSPSVTLTDYQPYIHTSSYSPSVLFSWLFHLRLIIHAKLAQCSCYQSVASWMPFPGWRVVIYCSDLPFSNSELLEIWTIYRIHKIRRYIHQSNNQLLCLVFYLKKGHFLPRPNHENFDLYHKNIHLTRGISNRFTTLRHAKCNIVVCFQNFSEIPRRMYHWLNTKVILIWPTHYFHVCHIIITKRTIIFIRDLTDCNL
jgi:hypothetical protein